MKDLTQVNGIKVIMREEAQMPIPGQDRMVSTPSVHRLLLADETVLFQCMHKNGEDCIYTAITPKSVTSHQRTHSDAKIARDAIARAKAAENELAARIQRRSDGSRKAAVTRKSSRAIAPVEIGNDKQHQGRRKPIGNEDTAKAAQAVITSFNAMQQCADEFQKVLIGYMRTVQTVSDTPVDPQILAKARAYDELKKNMFKA